MIMITYLRNNFYKVQSEKNGSDDVYQMRQSVRMMLYTLKEQ